MSGLWRHLASRTEGSPNAVPKATGGTAKREVAGRVAPRASHVTSADTSSLRPAMADQPVTLRKREPLAADGLDQGRCVVGPPLPGGAAERSINGILPRNVPPARLSSLGTVTGQHPRFLYAN
ncbi:hypothetical protein CAUPRSCDRAFT_10731 [Caulochytrium protostelioides]|uniref:Uncharacterized protein n=1 Tax=Caulochytrium protostelioides TaxID=1555241 RepID=A0A4P9WW44_9FUNG|nr:hypothetical protein CAUPRSCDRAFT_10731 [Caulochytrium protostelioides]